jgi:hypothetical protein
MGEIILGGEMCKHDLAEQDTACADGLCPLCLQAEVKRLREGIERVVEEWDNDRIVARFGEGKDTLLGLKELLDDKR